jgi:hypothetical protein
MNSKCEIHRNQISDHNQLPVFIYLSFCWKLSFWVFYTPARRESGRGGVYRDPHVRPSHFYNVIELNLYLMVYSIVLKF